MLSGVVEAAAAAGGAGAGAEAGAIGVAERHAETAAMIRTPAVERSMPGFYVAASRNIGSRNQRK
jgi:hypothetical protein